MPNNKLKGNRKVGADRFPHGKVIVACAGGLRSYPVPCPSECGLHVTKNGLAQRRFQERQKLGLGDDNVIVQFGVVKLCNLCNMPGSQHISWRHCIASLKQQVEKLRWQVGGNLA